MMNTSNEWKKDPHGHRYRLPAGKGVLCLRAHLAFLSGIGGYLTKLVSFHNKPMITLLIHFASKGHGLFRNIYIDRLIEYFIALIVKLRIFGTWKSFLVDYVQSYETFGPSQKFLENPARFLRSMAIVLRSPRGIQKGVILLAYNYAFPTFALLFDLKKLMKMYHIVLEPSTARYMMSEILMFKGFDETVFIEAGEPRDAEFLGRFMRNAKSVPISANWWIDSRIFTENPQESKIYDLIMVSSWLRLKRHKLLFEALERLKKKGVSLKCALVGYPVDMTKDEILELAKRHHVDELIEIFEWVPQKNVALLYQRSKLNLLLSKREGFNRSVIEGMYCNVPCLIRENFNFGHKYNYINNKTGDFFVDEFLDISIEKTLAKINMFSPRQWIFQNGMTAQNAAQILETAIYGTSDGILVPKISGLHGMEYWSHHDKERFADDYSFIMHETCMRSIGQQGRKSSHFR